MQRNAWLLQLSNGYCLAIAQQQVIEYLGNITTLRVPDCHPRCEQVLLWRNQVLPVLGALRLQQQHDHLLVLAYVTHHNGSPAAERIALSLQQPPTPIQVDDAHQCAPTNAQQAYWENTLRACVELDGQAVVLVDFAGFDTAVVEAERRAG